MSFAIGVEKELGPRDFFSSGANWEKLSFVCVKLFNGLSDIFLKYLNDLFACQILNTPF